MTLKTIILCADDFAFNEPVSQGILQLAQNKRISATSCMTNMKHWDEQGQELKKIEDLETGLHFNLTSGQPLSQENGLKQMFALGELLKNSFLLRLNVGEIELELEAQLTKFQEIMGRDPDFIDGHQHIHHFPQIREVLYKIYNKYFKHGKLYLRNAKSDFTVKDSLFKQWVINFCGASKAQKFFVEHKIPTNQSFSGIYSFSKDANYAELFPKFLSATKDQGMIMCHPGLESTDPTDEISQNRYQEYLYFSSGQFIQDCKANQSSVK